MNENSILYKVWRIIYPLIFYFLMDVVVVWLVETLILAFFPVTEENKTIVSANTQVIASVAFLILSIIVFYILYKKDYNSWAVWIYRKPQYFLLILIIGALASHGLSALVSLANIDGIIGSYSQIESSIFSANVVLVIITTVILAPVSEELLFRGILYKRLYRYFNGFWPSALISAALFGIYHFNLAQGVFAFLFGLLACAVYDKVHNLWAPAVLHIGGNLLSVILVYTGFNYSEIWIHIAVMAACLAAAWALYHFIIRPTAAITQKEISGR